jgi:hypothetical protein
MPVLDPEATVYHAYSARPTSLVLIVSKQALVHPSIILLEGSEIVSLVCDRGQRP